MGSQESWRRRGVRLPNDDPPPQGQNSQLANDPLVQKGQAFLPHSPTPNHVSGC